jgi:hypothetical protein
VDLQPKIKKNYLVIAARFKVFGVRADDYPLASEKQLPLESLSPQASLERIGI